MFWSNADPATCDPKSLELAEVLFSLSRRHALPFSVLALRVEGAGPADRAAARLEPLIGDELRQTDVLTRFAGSAHWTIFCPSTSSEGAKELAQRIRRRLDHGPLRIAVGSASFRDDGLALPDLVEAAWSSLRDTYGPEGRDEPPEDTPGGRGSDLFPTRRRRFSARLKRAFDLVAVVATAPLWGPLVGLCALAIKLAEPGAPVLFRQERTGRGGRRFEMLKFRTMVPDAEERKAELAHLNQLAWPDFKIPEDPRITRLGRFLRKTSLDELPQLFNVLSGEMSLVGPRPTSFAPETYEDWHTARLDVPPGVTGLWQIAGRSRTEFDERLRLDIEYVRRQSFLYDLGILLRTVPVVLTARGGH